MGIGMMYNIGRSLRFEIYVQLLKRKWKRQGAMIDRSDVVDAQV
jgi:hypothetical protein